MKVDSWIGRRTSYMANFKAKRPRRARAGCKMCKPHKKNRQAASKYRDKRQDEIRFEWEGAPKDYGEAQ